MQQLLSCAQGACLCKHPHPLPCGCSDPVRSSYVHRACAHTRAYTHSHMGCEYPGIQLQAARVCEQTHAWVQGAQIQPHTCRGSHSVPSPAGLCSQEGQQWLLCILCVSFQGSPQIPVAEPSKNEPGDKAADFLAHCPQPAATKICLLASSQACPSVCASCPCPPLPPSLIAPGPAFLLSHTPH